MLGRRIGWVLGLALWGLPVLAWADIEVGLGYQYQQLEYSPVGGLEASSGLHGLTLRFREPIDEWYGDLKLFYLTGSADDVVSASGDETDWAAEYRFGRSLNHWFSLYTGVAYRDWTTEDGGFETERTYIYSPVGLGVGHPMGGMGSWRLGLEYGLLWESDIEPGTDDDGDYWQLEFEFQWTFAGRNTVFAAPYVRQWSDTGDTTTFGLALGMVF